MSLGFDGRAFEGQTWEEIVEGMKWETPARVAADIVEAMLESPAESPVVINCNVPNIDYDDLEGWAVAPVGGSPPRTLTTSALNETDPDEHGRVFNLSMDWGIPNSPVEGTDSWLVRNKQVSVTWLNHLQESDPEPAQLAAVAARLNPINGH